MTTYTKAPTTTWSHSSDATFREWGKAISDGLAAVGLVKTSDTGQINWASVTRPGSAGYAGYEVWRFNDTSQSTQPIFLKIQYGTASSTSNGQMSLQAGQGSDGSGGLTGSLSPVRTPAQNQMSGSLPLLVTGGAGYVAVATPPAGGNNLRFGVERLRTSAGAASDRGVVMYTNAVSNGNYVDVWATSWTASNILPISWPNRGGAVRSGNSVFFSGATPQSGLSHLEFTAPIESTLMFGGISLELGGYGDTFAVPRWDGSTHTYICTGWGYCDTTGLNTTSYHYMLWE